MVNDPFPSFSRHDRLLARAPWPTSTGFVTLLAGGAILVRLAPQQAHSLFLIPETVTSWQCWRLWTGHFVQPDSFIFFILTCAVAALFSIEVETRWGARRLLLYLLIACPCLGLAWVGIQWGADQAGLIAGTKTPLAGFPLVTMLVAMRVMANPGDRLLGTGYQGSTLAVGGGFLLVLGLELAAAGNWTIVLPAHLVAWVLGMAQAALVGREERILLADLARHIPLAPTPRLDRSDWHDRLDHVLAKVAVQGLDGLTWQEWAFLRQMSRQLRQQTRPS